MVVKETDYLEHYGRKGMKWYQHLFGKEDPRARYSTTSGVKEGKAEAKAITESHNKNGTKLSELCSKMWNGGSDYTIPAGTKITRFAPRIENSNRPMYASFLPRDVAQYDSEFIDGHLGGNPYSSSWFPMVYRFEATRDLKVASAENSIDAMMNAMAKVAKKDKTAIGKEAVKQILEGIETSKDQYELAEDSTHKMMGYLYKQKGGIEALSKEMKKRGYDAMFDYEDSSEYYYDKNDHNQGIFKYAQAPLLIFDRKAGLKKVFSASYNDATEELDAMSKEAYGSNSKFPNYKDEIKYLESLRDDYKK